MKKTIIIVSIVLGFLAVIISSPLFARAEGSVQTPPAAGQGFYGDVTLAVPKLEQSKMGTTDSKYFSTNVDRNISLGPQSNLSGTAAAAAAATRCPAFVKWQDWWGGARWHAYVDFHPSDWCNGRHVKRAYVRLIRRCGPYYDTGRIYTYSGIT